MKLANIGLLFLCITGPINQAFCHDGGAADPGGGNLIKSNLSQVKKAFEKSIKKFRVSRHELDKKPLYNDFSLFLYANGRKKDAEFISEVFSKATSFHDELKVILGKRNQISIQITNLTLDELENNVDHSAEIKKLEIQRDNLDLEFEKIQDKADPVNFFNDSKFILLSDKPCLDLEGNEKDGSVTGLYRDAKICISFHRLKRVSPLNLEKEINGLLLHEISHLGGYKEVDAVRIQRMYLDVANYLYDVANFSPVKIYENISYNFLVAVNDLYYSMKSLELRKKNLEKSPKHWTYQELLKMGQSLGSLKIISERIWHTDLPKDLSGLNLLERRKIAQGIMSAFGKAQRLINHGVNQNHSAYMSEKELLEDLTRIAKSQIKSLVELSIKFDPGTEFFYKKFDL